jgi:hypothetical protein
MDNRIRIRKPYDQFIDEALNMGKVDVPAEPNLYLTRLRELEGAIDVEKLRQGTLRLTRTEDALEKMEETQAYSNYRRRDKWKNLL